MKKDKVRRNGALAKSAKGELKKQLLSYSVVAGAALIGAPYADAGIVYSGPQNITVDSGTPSVDIDMDGAGPADFNFQWNGAVVSHWSNTLQIFEIGTNSIVSTGSAGPSAYASRLTQSSTVSAGATWESSTKLLAFAYGYGTSILRSSGSFLGAKGFIGVRFKDFTNAKRFGWIEFEGAGDASWGRITGWAYDDTGDPIHVGDTGEGVIPEPSGLALLAAGAAGLMAFRKKRTE